MKSTIPFIYFVYFYKNVVHYPFFKIRLMCSSFSLFYFILTNVFSLIMLTKMAIEIIYFTYCTKYFSFCMMLLIKLKKKGTSNLIFLIKTVTRRNQKQLIGRYQQMVQKYYLQCCTIFRVHQNLICSWEKAPTINL